MGVSLQLKGDLLSARESFEQGIALYGSPLQRSRVPMSVLDPGIGCQCHLARTLWLLGYPDQALRMIRETVAMAQGLRHPESSAFALVFTASVHHFRRERQMCQENARMAISLSTEQGLPFYLVWASIYHGWAVAKDDHFVEGIAQIREGLTRWSASGSEVVRPYFLALLADALMNGGHREEALSAAAEGLEVASRTGERYYEAELYRLKGESLRLQAAGDLLAGGGDVSSPSGARSALLEKAEACFREAIGMARRQQARSLELRAAMGLSRLYKESDRKGSARSMLAEVYGWFTEGFETEELREARGLLQELL
ncbi:MAG: hypothetical protein DMF49_08330 [Acidobacteria bacterium]|nr:MAG: hypothetical protein DMF49_08330 [Acidobacteriota bacterium]